jgi:hypothetical protein
MYWYIEIAGWIWSTPCVHVSMGHSPRVSTIDRFRFSTYDLHIPLRTVSVRLNINAIDGILASNQQLFPPMTRWLARKLHA